MIYLNKYISQALGACKNFKDSDLFSWVVKGTGAAIAGGGTAYLLNRYGIYAPALPIAIGSATWSLGEAVEAFDIYRIQNMADFGSKINMAGACMRAVGAMYLAARAGLVAQEPGYDALRLVDLIVQGGGFTGLGYGVEYGIGRPLKLKQSKRWITAERLEKLAKRLRNEKNSLQGDDFREMRELYTEEMNLSD